MSLTKVTYTMIEKGDANAFDFLTAAQKADVLAYSFGVDVTSALQNAIDTAFANNQNLFLPAGGYLVTGLNLPGRVIVGQDDRGKAFRLYGQGTGEPFVIAAPKGTWVKSVTDAPVLQDYLDTASSSNGQVEVDHIRFDGTSNTTPVVRLQSFYGLSTFSNCVVYQRGTGDGLTLGWGATVLVRECYVLNKDWNTFILGAARTGVGISYNPTANNGLVTIQKCTSRGWLTGYTVGGGTGAPYSVSIDKCECSVVYNGVIVNSNANKCIISNGYFEGGDGGIGITNDGQYTTIKDNLIFKGFSTVIQDTSTSNKGTLIQGNVISIGDTVNGIGVDITSSAAFGGWNKNIVNNSIAYTLGTNGVNGIKLSGVNPRINITGNSFDPKTNWTGTSTLKINDLSTAEGPYGIITQAIGDYEFPVLSSGAISLFRSNSTLTEANVSANILTLPNGSYFVVTATGATTVQRFDGGALEGRFVILRTTNANMTFTDTAYIQTAGAASFTGPGTITFFIDKVGSDYFAYEIARTVF